MKMFVTTTSPKVDVTASKLVPRKDGVLGVSKLFRINLAFLNVGLVIGVSIDIFLEFFMFFFVFFFNIIVMGLNVSELDQMYEILG